MEKICPKCSYKIPQGNDTCNLCGFDYKQHLQNKAKQQNQTTNPAASIVPGILFGLTVAGGAVFFAVQRLETISPEKILEIVRYFPIIMPIVMIAMFAIIFAVIARNQKK
jgi:hypothetical protein